jgi:Txe/YoeB family toxin of Txe-Axe toxin-antitoxin module
VRLSCQIEATTAETKTKNQNEKMKLTEIKEIIKNNKAEGRFQFEGLTSSEIGAYSRYLMFGDNDEAFPDQETWALITD